MADIPLDQVVRLTPWNVGQDAERGQPYGTSVTAMNIGPNMNVKLMRTAAADYLQRTPEPMRFFLPEDQLFVLVPAAEGGFRILKHQTDMCLEGGPWWEPAGKRSCWLAFKPLDEASVPQIFFAEKGEGFSGVDAYKLFCMVDGERVDLTADRDPSKEWVGLALMNPGAPSRDLYAVQPQPGALSPALRGPSPVTHLKMTNRTTSDATFELSWSGGSLPPLTLKAFESGTMTLDGVTPPHGTNCAVAARSGGKVIEAGNFTSGPSMYSPNAEYILTSFMSARGPDVGFEIHANLPR